MNKSENMELIASEPLPMAQVSQAMPTPLAILEAAVRGGITSENVAVVKELRAMCQEEKNAQSKTAFNRAFFNLKKDLPPIYADKEVRTKSGALAFEYCSPQEIKNVIEPLLLRHGFCIMGGQELKEGEATVTLTLIHDAGHEETRSFTVRVSPGNQLMSPSQCDAAGSTTAERHALIKMFGLRTRIQSDEDPRLSGETITKEQAEELEHRLSMVNGNRTDFLKFAQASSFKEIKSGNYQMLSDALEKKERGGK